MREIVFDTETTGLRPEEGERIIEIGAVELVNRFPTGEFFHVYINPQGRKVHPDALNIHGISDSFLADKPDFNTIAPQFLSFISDAVLVAHNASFDMGFINAELARIDNDPIPYERVIDTLALARRKHPMGPNSLDALCSRYNIDNSHRSKHGALLDSELLAEVFIEMTGGRQATLVLEEEIDVTQLTIAGNSRAKHKPRPQPPGIRITEIEKQKHRKFIDEQIDKPIWQRYL
jgi:DNA polymerase III subunit epsilon